MDRKPLINNRGDMSAFAEGFPHEDFFMQQARRNGIEIGVSDPSVATAGLITFISGLVNAKKIGRAHV